MKKRRRLEVELAWLKACLDMTPQEKLFLALVALAGLVGVFLRGEFRTKAQFAPIPQVEEQLRARELLKYGGAR